MPTSKAVKAGPALDAAWLALLLWMAGQRMARVFPPEGALNGDAQWTYLPNARRFLTDPWTFLSTDPASYFVAPLGYLWPALWGADQHAIQLANAALFLVALVLLWFFVRQLGGSLAAAIATALLVGHPQLSDYIPQVLTESMFFFGWALMLFAIGRAVMGGKSHRKVWLGVASAALAITLLVRPVLQLTVLVLMLLATLGLTQRRTRELARAALLTLLLAAVLPVAVVIKNGVCFGVWGLATGSGSGLLYGLDSLRNGAEPVYSNFSYNADVLPLAIDPSTKGNPLLKRSDQINQSVALETFRQTSAADQLGFLARKLHMWLFTSTPELFISMKLRWFRLAEWMLIASAIALLVVAPRRRRSSGQLPWPRPSFCSATKLWVLGGLLLNVLFTAAQLTPVLYNTRYASFFIEPTMAVLAGVAVGHLAHEASWSWLRWPKVSRLAAVAWIGIVVWIAHMLAGHALRREVWAIDAHRPGPTTVVAPAAEFRRVHAQGMTRSEDGRWIIEATPAVLYVDFDARTLPFHDEIKDALWRMEFSLTVPSQGVDPACNKVRIAVDPHQPEINWYQPPPVMFIKADGQPHRYLMAANGLLRPTGLSRVALRWDCPVGSVLSWHAMELRRTALERAARAYFDYGTPIDPYLHTGF